MRDFYGTPVPGGAKNLLDSAKHSAAAEAQPFFEPHRVRALLKRVNELPPQDSGAFEGAVLVVVTVLQERLSMTA